MAAVGKYARRTPIGPAHVWKSARDPGNNPERLPAPHRDAYVSGSFHPLLTMEGRTRMNATRIARAATLLLLSALLCFAVFVSLGSSVDSDGILHEPFALVGLGWILCAGALALYLLAAYASVTRARAAQRDP